MADVAEIDLGKVKLTEKEMLELIDQYLGGIRLGKDENGNPGYYKYDEEAGADTLVPFSKGGGGGGEFIYPMSPVVYAITSTSASKNMTFYNNYGEYKKLKVKGRVRIKNTATVSRTIYPVFSYYNKNADGSRGTLQKMSLGNSLNSTTTTEKSSDFEKEIDLENVWFPNANNSYCCGIGAYLSATGSCDAHLDIDEIIFSK